MDDTDRILQRYVDGELDADKAAAVAHLAAANAGAAVRLRLLETADRLLSEHAATLPVSDPHALLGSAMARLPAGAPQRRSHVRVGDMAFASTIIATVGVLAGVSRRMSDVLPLTLLALVSMAVGTALILGAGPLLRGEHPLLSRVLGKRIEVADGGVLLYRLTGIAIVLGGIWMVT